MCIKAKYEALKEEFTTYSRVLHETEDALQRVNVERTHCTNEMNEITRDIETLYHEKIRLEDEVLEKIRLQLTADKAAQYSAKIVSRLRERTKDLETQVCTVITEHRDADCTRPAGTEHSDADCTRPAGSAW